MTDHLTLLNITAGHLASKPDMVAKELAFMLDIPKDQAEELLSEVRARRGRLKAIISDKNELKPKRTMWDN